MYSKEKEKVQGGKRFFLKTNVAGIKPPLSYYYLNTSHFILDFLRISKKQTIGVSYFHKLSTQSCDEHHDWIKFLQPAINSTRI